MKKKQRGWSAALRLGNLFEFELYLHLTLVLTDELQVHTNLSTFHLLPQKPHFILMDWDISPIHHPQLNMLKQSETSETKGWMFSV